MHDSPSRHLLLVGLVSITLSLSNARLLTQIDFQVHHVAIPGNIHNGAAAAAAARMDVSAPPSDTMSVLLHIFVTARHDDDGTTHLRGFFFAETVSSSLNLGVVDDDCVLHLSSCSLSSLPIIPYPESLAPPLSREQISAYHLTEWGHASQPDRVRTWGFPVFFRDAVTGEHMIAKESSSCQRKRTTQL